MTAFPHPRFDDLRKLAAEPARALLARGHAALQTPLDAPEDAPAATLLAELSGKGATADMLLLLAHALPAREAVWWACLSARDLLDEGAAPTAPLAAAEAWVLRPGAEARVRARAALEGAHHLDDSALCAMAASMADGTLGPGELEDFAAPAGAVGGAAHAMALLSLYHDETRVETQGRWLVARALDIARGGSGQVPAPASDPTPAPARGEDPMAGLETEAAP
ncbi:MAG: hypothetical protein VYD87_01460 [Pseudomonadota bacterium]|nr:hypothetical protein [Pseudomonadota bacterium]MEE3099086.1 hypothetical protein [Pseudomonadota bacterium]